MMSTDNSHRFNDALARLAKLDEVRNTNYKEIFKNDSYFIELETTDFIKSQTNFWGNHSLIWNVNLQNVDYQIIQQELLREDIWEGNQPQGVGRFTHNHSSTILERLSNDFSLLKNDILNQVYNADPTSFKSVWFKGLDYYQEHTEMHTSIYKDTAGFAMTPHLDNHHVIIQIIINLQNNTGSTKFYDAVSNKIIYSGSTELGEGVMFFNNANSVHSIDGITEDRFILYSYIAL